MSINKLHLTAITTTIDNKQECSSWSEAREAIEEIDEREVDGESGEKNGEERGRLRRYSDALTQVWKSLKRYYNKQQNRFIDSLGFIDSTLINMLLD